MISAKIIADSLMKRGHRLTTFLLVMPRIVLAEFNTHRSVGRNSASSRAIPFMKVLRAVWRNPFIPIGFMKEHTGMQGTTFFTGFRATLLRWLWLLARIFAIVCAWLLHVAGLSKQICNRILEPWMYHTVIATASEWENFLALRAHSAAEIHIQDLAYKMLNAYNSSRPNQLAAGQWHIPFGDDIDEGKLCLVVDDAYETIPYKDAANIDMDKYYVRVATARCARVSYTVVGEPGSLHNYLNDLKLHDRLASMGHWSPFEHCAQAMNDSEYETMRQWQLDVLPSGNAHAYESHAGWCKNYRGFIQYRAMFPHENKKDDRVIKHRWIRDPVNPRNPPRVPGDRPVA